MICCKEQNISCNLLCRYFSSELLYLYLSDLDFVFVFCLSKYFMNLLCGYFSGVLLFDTLTQLSLSPPNKTLPALNNNESLVQNIFLQNNCMYFEEILLETFAIFIHIGRYIFTFSRVKL